MAIPYTVYREIVDEWALETWMVALYNSGDPTTWTTYSSTGEVTGGNYSQKQLTLSTGYGNSNAFAYIKDTTTSWTGATFTATHYLIYETGGNKVRASGAFAATQTVSNGTLTLTWDATYGIIKVAS